MLYRFIFCNKKNWQMFYSSTKLHKYNTNLQNFVIFLQNPFHPSPFPYLPHPLTLYVPGPRRVHVVVRDGPIYAVHPDVTLGWRQPALYDVPRGAGYLRAAVAGGPRAGRLLVGTGAGERLAVENGAGLPVVAVLLGQEGDVPGTGLPADGAVEALEFGKRCVTVVVF